MESGNSIISRIINNFLKGNLAILLIIISLVAGAIALLVTPREEEPQIVVPLADVLIMYPGGSAEEVEQLVSARLERLLYQIDGVEYVYSMSRPGMAVVTVRFFVGQDREESLIKLYNQLQQNIDKVTPGISGWVVKPIEIDDVPIVNVTLFSDTYDTHALYRVAEEVIDKLQRIENSARITIHGGQKRVVHVYLDSERLSAYGLSAMEIMGALKISNVQMESGAFAKSNALVKVEAGPFVENVDEVRNLLVGLYEDRPVYLRDVANVVDGPEEINSYSHFGFGPAGNPQSVSGGSIEKAAAAESAGIDLKTYSAITIAVAKKKGSNAVWVAKDIEKMMVELKSQVIPDEVRYRITRNYGETANDKINDLVKSLGEAIISVILLIAIFMSWREGLVVAIAVPITYSVTLLFNYLFGYTINRVTLFALILALGLLVDDPIVGVDNISRHLSMRRLPRLQAVSAAMSEVLGPIILATLAVIVSFIPMFFITGMMGPYMRPMALSVPLTMLTSMLVSFAITPWVSNKLLRVKSSAGNSYDARETGIYRFYERIMLPLVESRIKSMVVVFIVAILFGLSLLLAATGQVPLKMLPFDNKNEFQIVVDMPESTTLETTAAVSGEIENLLRSVPEITDFTTTVGTASPMDFNGLVRHYYLREGSHLADIRVNLLHRKKRQMDSHAIMLRIRNDIDAIAEQTGANIKLIEIPPGPPVLATVVAEVYGQPYHSYDDLIEAAGIIKDRLHKESGTVDIDDSVESHVRKVFFDVDREKAGLNGISTEDIVNSLYIALSGREAGVVHIPTEQNELSIVLRLPRQQRSDIALLKKMIVKGRSGQSVQLGELGTFEEGVYDKTIYHKNQKRVVYVMSEMAGRGPAYAILSLQKYFNENPLAKGIHVDWRGEGEWKITLDVFRDLGIAFAVAMLAIYVLLVYEMGSYLLPVIVMLSIPLTLIGIMPGFWILNLLMNRLVGGFENPVFFTATAMIGMIALGGIVVRNAIILIDFIKTNTEKGKSLKDAIIESGAVRFRPIFLTTGTTMLGAWPITLDPIFSGLAWALIFGLLVSTAFTLVVIPTVYYLAYGAQTERNINEVT
ncbi:MAG: efflux RND transporter permease subunit [Deltaproteobacteria bacterium]|nr:MAG: efflux RND transporter permease subunit [Deltaproteobacteria bacterium]